MERRRKRLCGRHGVFTRAFSMFVSVTMVLNLVPAQGIAWAKDELLSGDGSDVVTVDYDEELSREAGAISGASVETEVTSENEPISNVEAEQELGTLRVFVEVSGVEEDTSALAYNVTIIDAYGRWLDKQMQWVERNQSLIDEFVDFVTNADDDSEYEHVVTPSQDLVIDNVPAGVYEVRETQTGRDIEGYTFDESASVTEAVDVVVTRDSTAEARISNVYEKIEIVDTTSEEDTEVAGDYVDPSASDENDTVPYTNPSDETYQVPEPEPVPDVEQNTDTVTDDNVTTYEDQVPEQDIQPEPETSTETDQTDESEQAAASDEKVAEEASKNESNVAEAKTDDSSKETKDTVEADKAANEAKSTEEKKDEAKDEKKSESKDESKADAKDDEKDKGDRNVEKTLVYENGALKVTATLDDPASLPAGVRLMVTEVNKRTLGYNYKAYMDALNATTEDEDTYTDKNTLLYDVAFIGTDENGNKVEYEPEEGSVRVEFNFKHDQLAEEINAKKPENITVTHLSLSEKAKEGTDTTAEVTDFKSKDVSVEEVDDVSTKGDNKLAMTVDSLSVYGFTYTVDLKHGDMSWSFGGDTSVRLSKVFEELGIEEDVKFVKDVTFSDPTLIEVKQKVEDWELKSLKAFKTEETLTITMHSGEVFEINVMDSQSYTVTVAAASNLPDSVQKNWYMVLTCNGKYRFQQIDITQGGTFTFDHFRPYEQVNNDNPPDWAREDYDGTKPVTVQLVSVDPTTVWNYPGIAGYAKHDGETLGNKILHIEDIENRANITFSDLPNYTININVEDADIATLNGQGTSNGRTYWALLKLGDGDDARYLLKKIDTNTTATVTYSDPFTDSNGANPVYYTGAEEPEITLLMLKESNLSLQDALNKSNYSNKGIREIADGTIVQEHIVGVETEQGKVSVDFDKLTDPGPEKNKYKVTLSFVPNRGDRTKLDNLNDDPIEGNSAVLVQLKRKGSENVAAWAIKQIAADELNNDAYWEYEFKKADFMVCDANGRCATSDTVHYNPDLYDVSVRYYYKESGEFTVTKGTSTIESVTEGATDWVLGYSFSENVSVSANQTDLYQYKAYANIYQLRVDVDPATMPSNGKHYYVLVEASHQTTGTAYYLAKIDPSKSSETFVINEVSDHASHWKNFDGRDRPNERFSTQEEIVISVISSSDSNLSIQNAVNKSGCTYHSEGSILNGGTYVYWAGDRESVADDDAKQTTTTDVIILKDSSPTEPALTPEQVLGDAYEFGIVADSYIQDGHTETNFAVKHYNHGSNFDFEGTREGKYSDVPFYAAELQNGFIVGSGTKADIYLYAPQSELDKGITQQNDKNKYIVVPTAVSKDEIEAYVDDMIYSVRQTSEMMGQKTTVRPAAATQGPVNLDFTGYPDNKTIYVDCANIMDWMKQTDQIHINKLDGQTVIMNILDSGHIDIGKFSVYTPNHPSGVESTTIATNRDDSHNLDVDDAIFSHVFFNMPNATTVHTDNASAMFLAPNATMFTQSNGAGWIVCGGTVDSHAEWHFYRHNRHFSSTIGSLQINKKLNADAPSEAKNKIYKFYVRSLVNNEFIYYYTNPDPQEEGEDYNPVITSSAPHVIEITGTGNYRIERLEPPKSLEVIELDDDLEIDGYSIEVTNGTTTAEIRGGRTTYVNVTNTYTKEQATNKSAPKVKKTVNGNFTGDDKFTFKIEKAQKSGRAEGDTLPDTTQISVAKGESKAFSGITFANVGTYYYKITEVEPTDNKIEGMTYNTEPVYAKVVVTTENNEFKFKWSYSTSLDDGYSASDDGAVITNTYTKLEAKFMPSVVKVVSGDAPSETYNFTLTDTTSDETLKASEQFETNGTKASVTENGTAEFGEITYTKKGTYTYEITEDVPDPKTLGMTYSQSKVTLTVLVDDDTVNGGLKATGTYSGGDDATANPKNVLKNTYVAPSSSDVLKARKTIKNGTQETLPANEQFSFKAEKTSGDNDGVSWSEKTAKNDANGTITFETLSFSKPGTYDYKVTETSASGNGYTKDSTEYLVKYVVDSSMNVSKTISSDNGQSYESAPLNDTSFTFTNQYSAASVTVALSGTKSLKKGADDVALTAGQFTFTVTPDSANPATGANESNLKKTGAQNDKDGAIDYGSIIYTEPGEWTYVVSESDAGESSGIVSDSKTYTVKVKVEDNGAGKLTASTQVNNGDWSTAATDSTSVNSLNFTNELLAGTATLQIKKKVSGDIDSATYDAVKDEQFTFTLAKVGETPVGDTLPSSVTATAKAGQTAMFGAITYSAPGEYLYSITESAGNNADVMTYDTTPRYAKVVVTKNDATKQLDTAVTYSTEQNGTYAANLLEVTNIYTKPSANKVTVTLSGTKTLKNGNVDMAMTAGQFSFAVTPHADNPTTGANTRFTSPATNDAEGNISFGAIDFTGEGTWKYNVRETSANGQGITVDTAVYTVTYEVQEDSQTNALTVVNTSISEKKGDNETPAYSIIFRNTYEAAPVQVPFKGTKNLAGGTVQNGQFSFELKGISDNASATDVSVTNDADGKFDFGTITYTTPGTYKYTVRETGDNASSVDIELSNHVYNVTVVVTDNGEGQLVANVVDSNDATKTIDTNNLDLTNTVLSGSATLGVNKIVKGNTDRADYNANEEYVFTLAKATGSTHTTDVIATPNQLTMKAGENKSFGAITYKQAGTYYYSIAETPGNTTGMTYAPVQYVKVVVERGGIADTETLKVTSIKYGPSLAALKDDNLSFAAEQGVVPMINTYAKTTFIPNVLKTYEGENRPAETFKFTLTDKTEDQYKPGESIEAGGEETTVAMAATDTSREATFGTFTYTKPGIYVYEIEEVAGETRGMHYATGKVTLTVEVTADSDGKLSANSTYEGGTGDEHAFNNVYDHNQNFVTEPLDATKTLNGKAPGERQFTFKVTPDQSNPTDGVDEKRLDTEERNNADGEINFGEIEFSKEGTWSYEIKETSDDGNGVTVDKSVYTVRFVVTKNSSGQLSATRAITKTLDNDSESVDSISFANTYDAADATLTLSGKKQLVDGTLTEDQFSFELVDDKNKVVETVKNKADGTYKFSDLTFGAEGTYTYTVREVASTAEDIDSDDTVYNVSVVVTDNHNGSLVATPTIVNAATNVSVKADELNFKNVQLKGSAQIQVNKLIQGYAGDEDFEFNLVRVSGPEGGDQLPTNVKATAKAGGTAKFDAISYSKTGTYLYKITETKGQNAGIEYDDSAKYAKVVVSRSESKGEDPDTLTCVVSYGNESSAEACAAASATFTNTVGGPAVEKYVNQDVHQDLDTFDSTFTYDILAYVTADADKVVVTDTLEAGIAFKSKQAEVKVADLGTVNDHTVKSTVKEAGTAINAGVTIDGKNLTVVIDNATLVKSLRGHWVKVTYDAQLDNDVVNTYATYEDNDTDIDGNAPVLGGSEIHSGVANKAGYQVFVKVKEEGQEPTMPSEPTYEKESNTVTVTPKTTNLKVEKVWKGASDEDLTWPEGVKTTVEVKANDASLSPQLTHELTKAHSSYTFENLPVFEGVTYSVSEKKITGGQELYTSAVTGSLKDGFTITNTRLEGEAEVSVKKVVSGDAGWNEDESFDFKLSDPNDNNAEIGTVSVKAGETKSFEKISYTKPGEYTYTIAETKGATPNMTYDTTLRYVKVVVTPNNDNTALKSTVTYSSDGVTYESAVPVFTNNFAAPAIEKYVNQQVHDDIAAFDSTFTYDILAYVTADADHMTISDALVDGIEFACEPNEVGVADLGAANDHKEKGTVAAAGTTIEDATVAINNKNLTVTIPDTKSLRGHWIKVSYAAKLDNDVVDTWATYQSNKQSVENNAPVLSEQKHAGVPNTASYKVFTVQAGSGEEKPAYEETSNTVTVTPAKVDVSVEKAWKDSTGKAIAWPENAKVTVTLLKTEGSDTTATGLTIELTAEKSAAAFEDLPVYEGVTYSVAEASVEGVPNGFMTSISKGDGNDYTITNTKTGVKISKVDITNEKEIEGAKIEILNASEEVVTSWTSTTSPHLVEGLVPGVIYTLRETTAPLGYAIATDTTFALNDDGTIKTDKEWTTTTVNKDGVLLVEDAPTVKVSKVETGAGQEIAGAHIRVVDSEGKEVDSWTSGTAPHQIEGLKVGEQYTLIETIAPDGYTIAANTIFSIAADGTVTANGTTITDGVLLIEDNRTEVKISKTDVTGDNEIAGAHIQIMARGEDGKLAVVKIDDKDVAWVSTDAPYVVKGLKTDVEYTLRETVAPDGYTIATDTTFVIDKEGKVTTTGSKTEDGILLVKDSKTRISISKREVAGSEELRGATIQILTEGKDGKLAVVILDGKPVEWVSTDKPHVVEGLTTGVDYVLRETVAPDRYKIATDITFSIDENGNVSTDGEETEDGDLLIENALAKVSISKVDITSGAEVADAHIQVIKTDKDGNETNVIADEWNSTTEPHEISGLTTGVTYILRETVAPDGYAISTDTRFTLKADGTIDESKTTTSTNDDGVLLVEDDKTVVKVSKTDITGDEELVGAHIQVLTKDQSGKESIVQLDGKDLEWDSTAEPYTIRGLKTGVVYILRETVAPDGYALATDTAFTIDEHGNVTATGSLTAGGVILIKDAKSVQVSKVDTDAGNEVAGATIRVLDSQNNVVDEWVSGTTPHTVVGVRVGETYTLRETVAPDGYAVTTDTTFKIAADGTVTTTASRNDKGVLLVEDDLTKVKVSKVDIANGKEIVGATIQVLDSKGDVVVIDGKPVEWTSGKIAHEIVGLKTGETYTLREIVAPDGYAVATDIEFSIDSKGIVTTKAKRTSDGTILIEDAKTKVIVSKRDIAGGAEIADAKLQVISIGEDGKESIAKSWTSEAGKSQAIEGLLTDTEYILRETVAPDGYAITTDIKFTIDKTGKVTTSGKTETDKDGNTVLVVDNAKTKFTVSKTDITGEEEISGAYIAILDAAGNPARIGDEPVAWTSTDKPYEIVGLKAAETYILRETTAPDGYTIAADTTFTLTADGKVMVEGKQVTDGHILIKDSLNKIFVSKRDVTGEEELAGAKIQILDEQGDVVTTVKGEKLEWESTDTPKQIEGLKANVTYTLHEETAPEGYTVAADTTFTINENGKVTTTGKRTTDGNGNTVLLINDSKTSVKVSKVDIAGGEELAGATIQVIDAETGKVAEIDGKKVEWVSDTNAHEIVGLTTGKEYLLRETVAPEGYAIATDTAFTIDEAGKVTTTGTITQDGVILIEDEITKVLVSKTAVGGGAEVAGATLQVIDAETGKVAEIAGRKVEWVSGTKAYEIVGLTAGKNYLLRETVAPKGYGLLTTDIAFSIDKAGKVTTEATITKDGAILVEDDITTVTVSKRAVTGGEEELEGAHIQIIDQATGEVAKDLQGYSAEWVSRAEEHTVRGLEAGKTYILRETVAPDGYTIATATIFTIDEYGTVTSQGKTTQGGALLIEDALTKVTVSKKAVGGEDELAGARIQILDADGNVVLLDKGNMTEKLEWVSTDEPRTIEGLKTGVTYTLHEVVAPDGYAVASDIEFSIDKQGNVIAGDKQVEGNVLLIEDALTKVTISKRDVTGGDEELPGATIQIIEKDDEGGETIAREWTSTEEAEVIEGLKTGVEYVLRETFAPDGYATATDTTFTIDENGRVTTSGSISYDEEGNAILLVEDAKTRVLISKADIDTGAEIKGAKISILDEDGKVVEIDGKKVEWVSASEPYVVEGLKTGITYTLHEDLAPAGYAVATDTTFTIEADGTVTVISAKSKDADGKTVLLVNDAMTRVSVSKTAIGGGEELAGAHIEVFSIDETGKEIVFDEWDSSDAPHEIVGLTTGVTYTLRETVAPEGYTIASTIDFVLDRDGNVTATKAKVKDGVILIEDAPTKVSVSKTDIAGGEELAGATIQILDAEGKVVEEWVSETDDEKTADVDEGVHEILGLKAGETYVLRETVAPEGYAIATDTTFTIDETGKVTTTGSATEDGVILIEDALTKVSVSKVAVGGGEEIAGAEIQLMAKDADGNLKVVRLNDKDVKWTSGDKPHDIVGLAAGDYVLRETVAPKGYAIATDIAFTLNADGTVTTKAKTTEGGVILIEDAMTSVKVSKVDTGAGEELAGAQIQVIDSEGNVVEEWVSRTDDEKTADVDEGVHEIYGLKTGVTYTLRETVAPDGYAIATDTTFTIDEAGKVTTTGTMTQDGVILVEDDLTKVKVSKVDICSGEEIAGAHIQIIDSEGNVVEEWVSRVDDVTTTDINEGVHEIYGLKTGVTYTLRETVAPDGYAIATDTTFTIDETGKVTTTGSVTEDGVILIEDARYGSIVFEKVVTSPDPTYVSNDEFEFTLVKDDAKTSDVLETSKVKVKDGEKAEFRVTYNETGTYYYRIVETEGTSADENLYYADPQWVKVVVESGQDGQFETKVTYGESREKCDEDRVLFRNIYSVPALEKYVNKDVHQDLSAFDKPFTYDILAFVTKDADKVVITDRLTAAKGIRFAQGADTKVYVTCIGYENDHHAHGSVEQIEGIEIPGAEIVIDEETGQLTVLIPEDFLAANLWLRGQWIRVTYDVVLDNTIVGNEEDYETNDDNEHVNNNKTVISDKYPEHDGVETTASYEVYTRDENGDLSVPNGYRLVANDITVTPPTVNVKVEKVWKDANGNVVAWPAGAQVTVELLAKRKGAETAETIDVATKALLGDSKALERQTATLTADKTSYTFAKLPVYDSLTYLVAETSVTGVPSGYTTAVSGSAKEGYTITNTVAGTSTPTSTSTSSYYPTASVGGAYYDPYYYYDPYPYYDRWSYTTSENTKNDDNKTTTDTNKPQTTATTPTPVTPVTPVSTPTSVTPTTGSTGTAAQGNPATVMGVSAASPAGGVVAGASNVAPAAKLAQTSDPTSMATVAMCIVSGAALVLGGRRRRRK